MTGDDIARVLLALEHDDMDRDVDLLYQRVCAGIATIVEDPDTWARLQRAALTCHHCASPA